MNKKGGFTFIEIVITISLISMLGAIGTVTFKKFEEFHNNRYAERELAIINDAYLYECANTDFDKISDIKNVDELISDNFVGKYEIIHEENSYSIKYYKNGNIYILKGNELDDFANNSDMSLVNNFTENVRQNMINEIEKFVNGQSTIQYGSNDNLREYLLENVYNGEWPQLTEAFCSKYKIPYNSHTPYYIEPYIYLSVNSDASEDERELTREDMEKVVVFIESETNDGWFAFYIYVEGQWYSVDGGVFITLPYDKLVKKINDDPVKFKPLK